MKKLLLFLLLALPALGQGLPPCPQNPGGSLDINQSYCFFGQDQFWGGVDFGNAVFHGITFAPVSPPTALTIQSLNTSRGGLLAGTTYFWVVTALNSYGETTASNETQIAPGSNSSAQLIWQPSLGATSYNVYRGTSHGGETLCSSSMLTIFVDTGAACSGQAVPVINSSQPTGFGGGGGAVASVFGRTGVVTAATNDYSFSQISGSINLSTQSTGSINLATQAAGNLDVSHLNSGTNASSSTVWCGDGTWCTPAGGGNISNVGTPTNGQLAQWTGATTIQGVAPTLASSLFANQGTTTQVLHGNAAGNPSWSAVSLANDVTGNLAVTNLNSGTGATSGTAWCGNGTWCSFVSNSGTAFAIPFYTATGTNVGPTNMLSDSGGNNLTIPGIFSSTALNGGFSFTEGNG